MLARHLLYIKAQAARLAPGLPTTRPGLAASIAALLMAVTFLALLSACGAADTSTPTPTPSQAPPLLGAEEHFQRGNAFLEQKLPGAAMREYRSALKVDSRHVLARVGLGKAHAMRSEYDDALDQFRHTIRLDPNVAEAYFERGKVYGTQAKLTPAIKDFDRAIELDPDNAAAYNSRGFALVALGRVDEAIDNFDKAIELDPDLADAYANRAFTYAALGKDDDAESDAERAIELGLNANAVMEELETIRNSRQSP